MTRRDTIRRVLLATAASERGGAEGVIELLADRLPSMACHPVLSVPEDSPLAERWRRQGRHVVGAPVLTRLRRLDQVPRIVAAIAATLDREAVDVVHTHGLAAQLLAGRAARRRARPLVAHLHDRFDPRWSIDGALHRLALRVPRARTIAVSANVAATYLGRLPASQLEIIPNGVESTQVAPVRLAGNAPLAVWCGRLQRWKGCHLFLAAARLALNRRPDLRFAVVGGTLFGLEPGYPDELHAIVRRLDLANAVEFVGHVDDARPWLAAAALVVHSSVTPDPFPLVILEVMMQARPIVAFNQGGPAEAVVDGQTGRLVAPGDVDAMARAITELAASPETSAAMGAAGRARALADYDADVMTRRIAAVYDQVSTA